LQAKGKTVVVITHDDRYYHLADRYIKLDYGQVVELGRGADLRVDHPNAIHPQAHVPASSPVASA
ncbi:MAG TPA: cyclic peptide export ABC transporter, partial [Burkholderiales bacterium]|nr:cyclic peptide export ABC transporter [Burkholderiales bacterium]